MSTQGTKLGIELLRKTVAPEQMWGGNCRTEHSVGLASLEAWVYCNPCEPATCGGDVYYVSSCSQQTILRVVLADVSGHGAEFNSAAVRLRKSIERHIGTHDQTQLMRELNEDILSAQDKYATAVVIGYNRDTNEVLFTNAGHPPALWYHAATGEWHLLHHETPHAVAVEDLPIGLIPGTGYSQTAVRLAQDDLLVLYTDGFAEATNDAGEELGYEGLLKLATAVPTDHAAVTGRYLLAAVKSFCGEKALDDDCSMLVVKSS